jgi:hypothetical protein
LEVASDRLLDLIKKGVTVPQVAQVTQNFTQAGILVHAYLMYGYPTQTIQETVDSLEMVRQLFEQGVIQSGFWHRFAMTVHSPVGLNPKAFGVVRTDTELGTFANNEVGFDDPSGIDHGMFSEGLRKSLFNYMQGVGLELPLKNWFDFKLPPTSIPKFFIQQQLQEHAPKKVKDQQKICWLGTSPQLEDLEEGMCELIFSGKKEDFALELPLEFGQWTFWLLEKVSYRQPSVNLKEIRASYEKELGDFEELLDSEVWELLAENGLLLV